MPVIAPTRSMRPPARLGPAFAVVLALAPVTTALAQTALAQTARSGPVPSPIECTCRANGRSYHLGERTCLSTPDGYREAQCRMVQNVTHWAVETGRGCLVSGLLPERAAAPPG